MLSFLSLVNSEPLKCLRTPFVRQWVVYGLPSLCLYDVLTCVTLMFFTDPSCPLIFGIFVVAFFLNMHLYPWKLHKWRSHHLTAHPPLYFHLPVAPTLTFFPLPKCTCPSTWLSCCKPCFHFLKWPGDLLAPLWWVLFSLTRGLASVQPFPWLLRHCFLVCPCKTTERAQRVLLHQFWVEPGTVSAHSRFTLSEWMNIRGRAFCVSFFCTFGWNFKIILYCI